MEQKIYFNGKETTQGFIDNYIKENGGFMACKMAVEYNNGFIYDFEEDKKLTLSQGILTMDAGLADLADYGLTQEEQNIYNNLINKL